MSRTYKQPGEVIDYTNAGGAAIPSGAVVVIGAVLGVALATIPVGATGSVSISGVHELPKVTGAVIAQGVEVLWDVSAGKFDVGTATPATGDVGGKAAFAFAAAGNGATTVMVKLTGVPGTKA